MFLQFSVNSIIISNGNETNEFGKRTLSALIAFQKENNLISDGIAGVLTLEKLKQ